ncbi:MAG: PASTA domain-containing protein, partial [Huintestinicola sp.]
INLAKYLKQNAGELSWDEVKRLFPPIFTTLSLIHNAGIIHRGISPENIIVTDKNELKIIGFCIADSRTANTELASEIYHGYAAPEQYSSSNWQGTWTDVYGICALLYRILTGTIPENAMERVANDTLVEPKVLNDSIPANVSKVIMNGMALSGEMRIQTVTELVTQLFEEPEFNRTKTIGATQTISIPKQHSTQGSGNTSDRTKKKSARPSRHRVFIVAAITSVVVMGIFMGIFIMALDDNSGSVINGMTTISTEETTDVVTDEAGETVSAEPAETTVAAIVGNVSTIPTMPTLAVIENSSADESQTTFKPGSTVYIMNDLVGKSFDTVKNTSINDNLTIVPEYVYTEEYEKGMIFEQSIEKGANYEKGAEVVLKVSMGPPKVIVPDFYGLNKKDYFDILNNAGIKYEEKEYETDKTLNDYVMWLSIEPGEYIDLEAGEVLSVFVAKNPNGVQTESESQSVTEAPVTDSSTPWVTTVPPSVSDIESSETRMTDEPDIIITVDY